MIGVLFTLGTEAVEVRIDGTNLYFRSSAFGASFVPIEGLHLSEEGIYKEFPDLQGDSEYRNKAIMRLKDRIKEMKDENERVDYVVKELSRYGYVPKYKQRDGFRPERL